MSLLSHAAFGGIRGGLRFRVPDRFRTLEQHCRTIEEIRRRGVDLVLDVGANVGFYSQHLRQLGYKGRILAFEPVPHCFEQLQRRSKGDPEWQTFNFALGSSNGKLEFNVVGDSGILSSALNPRIAMPSRKIVVTVRTLADVLAETATGSERIFLKMDTQGFDLEVFKGSGNPPQIVLVQSELSVRAGYDDQPSYAEALLTFDRAGYELLDTYPVVRTPTGGIGEMDALMARR